MAALQLSIHEDGVKLHVQNDLAPALERDGWRIATGPDPVRRCALTLDLHTGGMGQDVFARYAFAVTTEAGVELAKGSGQVGHTTPENVRAQVVNAVRSGLVTGLAGHSMPDVFFIQGIENDQQVQALHTALSALPRISSVDPGHLSNGDLRFEAISRRPASAFVEPLGEVRVEGRRLEIISAGVDWLEARLK